MANITEIMQLCRLCLVKEQVNVPIFEGAGDIRQTLLKIKLCLPVKVDREDNLPKKICEGCVYKLDLLYEFYNTASKSEKQLLSWLSATDDNIVETKAKIDTIDEDLVISPTQIVLKEEPITDHPNDVAHEDHFESEFNNFYEGETNYHDAPETITTSELVGTDGEPPSKRPRRAAAAAAASTVALAAAESDDDDDEDVDDPTEHTITKTEDESEEEEDLNEDLDSTEAEPAFVDVSQDANPDAQPGPSGIQKAGDSQCICLICGKTFGTKIQLQKHVYVHRPKQLECPQCPKLFSRNSLLKEHVKNVHSTEILTCEHCGRMLKTRDSYLNHVRAHFNDYPHHCEICGMGLSTLKSLKQHREAIHFNIKHECALCGKIYSQNSNLIQHMKSHNPLYRGPDLNCKECEFVAQSQTSYYRHVRQKHGVESNLICDICGKEIASKRGLAEHLRIHNNIKPFCCLLCGKGFVTNYALKTHQRSHTKERPYECGLCAKGFAQKSGLNIHMRIHTGEKPYVCRICEKKFVSKSALNAHNKVHGAK